MSTAWTVLEDAHLRDRLFCTQLPDGPAVYVLPKPGFTKTHAALAVRFGSLDTRYRPRGARDVRRVPDGLAHFLEHQMFAQEDGDAFERFAALGASANAHTTYSATTYLFTATDGTVAALEHLLDFVQQPHFTDAGTDKERGIIQQEIRMYDDDPGWRLQRLVTSGLYREHPCRVDIAGTVETVAEITTAILRECHELFYHPANMVLAVVGAMEPDEVLEHASAWLGRHARGTWREPERVSPTEPDGVAQIRAEDRMAMARPLVALAFKDRQVPAWGRAQLERDLLTDIGLAATFGPTSDRFRGWYESGLIDRGFRAGYLGEATFALSELAGETDRPDELVEALRAAALEIRRDGVDAAACERQRRARMGEFVRFFDIPEALGNLLPQLHFNKIGPLEFQDVLEGVSAEAVSRRLAEHLDPDLATSAILRPTRG